MLFVWVVIFVLQCDVRIELMDFGIILYLLQQDLETLCFESETTSDERELLVKAICLPILDAYEIYASCSSRVTYLVFSLIDY